MRGRGEGERVAGLVLIAPAPDFTAELIEPNLTEGEKASLFERGYFEEPSEYSPEPNIFTRALIEDGRHYPNGRGDCEDFALEKRRRLMQKGFSAGDLLMTVVRKPDGEGHAVLTVRTAQGDFILDNLDGGVKLWTQTPYRFLKRQATNHSGHWVTIDNSAEVLVGSVGQ